MPRPRRLHVPGGCYHVTLRGNHREALFASAADHDKLNTIVADAIARFDARLHAFCWMTNHLHALVQIGETPLGDLVKSIAVRYSRYRHKAMDTTGHLFERRHGAKLVDVDAYFLAVLRYVHLNPVKAKMVGDPHEYRWSSHRAYLGVESIDWVTTDLGLSLLGRDPRGARAAYAELMNGRAQDDKDDVDLDLDDQILGDDDFAATVRAPITRRVERLSLDELAERVCADRGISVAELQSRSSSHSLTPIRMELLDRAVKAGIASLTEVADFLDRHPSTLSKQWKKHR